MKLSTKILSVAFVVAVAFAISATASAAIVSNLTVGSTGVEVTELQNALVAGGYLTMPAGVPMGYFGALTKAAVIKYQIAKGITPAAGYVGPITRASLASAPTTGGNLPAGCTSTAGYSPVTGAKCDSGSTSGALEGTAGDATVTKTSTDVEDKVNEGGSDVKVYGFKVEADGSDIALNSVKVNFLADGASLSSYRLSHYVDSVSIFEGSTKVGSADVADFTKDGNNYSKTIKLSDAIVRDGSANKKTFYVTVDAAENIDTTDFNATWTITVSNVRYEDAEGAILTAQPNTTTETFGFQSLATSGDVKVIVSKDSSSPIARDVTVSDTATTKDVLLLAFKVKATGGEVSFDTMNITLASTTDTMAHMISELQLRNGSDVLDTLDGADLVSGSNAFNLDDTFTIDADSTEVFKVYATVNDQSNFTSGSGLTASFASFSPEDSNGDIISDTGSATGAEQKFVFGTPIVTKVGTPTLTLAHQAADSNGTSTYTATIKFSVTAPDNAPVYVPLDTFAFGTAGTSGVLYTRTGTAPIKAAIMKLTDQSLDSELRETNSYRVDAGSTVDFTLDVTLEGDDSNNSVALTGLWYEITDATPNNTPLITGLSNISTGPVFLAK